MYSLQILSILYYVYSIIEFVVLLHLRSFSGILMGGALVNSLGFSRACAIETPLVIPSGIESRDEPFRQGGQSVTGGSFASR